MPEPVIRRELLRGPFDGAAVEVHPDIRRVGWPYVLASGRILQVWYMVNQVTGNLEHEGTWPIEDSV